MVLAGLGFILKVMKGGYERKDFLVFCVTKSLKITNDISTRSSGCLGEFFFLRTI